MKNNFKFLNNDFPYNDYCMLFENGKFKILAVDSFDEKNGIREFFYKEEGKIGKKICEHTFSNSGFDKKGALINEYYYEYNDFGFVLKSRKRSIFINEQHEENIQVLFDTTAIKHISGDLVSQYQRIKTLQPFNKVSSPFNPKRGMTKYFYL